MLTKEEVTEVFMNTTLVEDYNFLQEDLVKLANAFVLHAADKIIKAERAACIDFVRSLNTEVAKALHEKRGMM